MKKILSLLFAAVVIMGILPVVSTAAKAEGELSHYRIEFDGQTKDKVTNVYIPSSIGEKEEFSNHYSAENGILKRKNDLFGKDVTGNYAVAYLNDLYLRYFELETNVSIGSGGLEGIVFGTDDIFLRHMTAGNGVYFMPDPCVEVFGISISRKKSARFTQKSGFYNLKLKVCASFFRVYIDDKLLIDEVYPEELITYGRIGLFTANTDGSFSGGVTVYELNDKGERIPLENRKNVAGVAVTNDVIETELESAPEKLEYSVIPVDAANKRVRFLAEDPNVAIADKEGYIHALKEGTTVIYVIAEDGGFKDSVVVTVTKSEVYLQGVTLDKTSEKLAVGEKTYLIASYFPQEAENEGFKWSSSDTTVAIVNNGTVTAIGEGTCVITVKDYTGAYSAVCTVTVSSKSNEGKSCGASIDIFNALTLSALLLVSAVCFTCVRRKKI